MKKIYSLIKACMTSDMNIIKFKKKKNNKKPSILFPLIVILYLMFVIWGSVNTFFEKLAPTHMQVLLLPLFIFAISIMTIIEGIYKIGPLIFNCKDDDLLLSLPIKRSTVLFVRIFKFYVFELIFNSIFILPMMIAYIRWAEYLSWTYYLTNIIMLFFLPIIPIIVSSVIGAITSNIVSKFKYKNAAQIIITMIVLLGFLYLSYNTDGIFNYLIKHAESISDFVTKLYYPSGVYLNLITDFKIMDLLLFIVINVALFTVMLFILSKFYFKINSKIKKVTTTKKTKLNSLSFKSHSKNSALIKKELTTFFKTPVFITNAGFALVLFIIATIMITIRYDSFVQILTDPNGFNLSKSLITDNKTILIFLLISVTSYMTSITNSVISLEGRNINIIKSLPIKTKTILMSKIYSSLILTTPVLIIGSIVLFIKFKVNILEAILLLILSVLIPLVSHFIGILVNLKYPKLDAENSTEIVKQSMSSFISVLIGMILLTVTVIIIIKIIGSIASIQILLLSVLIYIIINTLLYLILITKGVKEFNSIVP